VQLSILWIADPSHYFDAVFRLAFKVVTDVVDDDHLAEITAQEAKILDKYAIIWLAVVPI